MSNIIEITNNSNVIEVTDDSKLIELLATGTIYVNDITEWGAITGTLSNQADLQLALDAKLEASSIANFETTTQLNARDTANRSRDNHTGTQAISTVTGLQTALDGKQATGDYATNTALTNGLATKENIITAGTTAQYFRGDKTFQTLDKTAVGLSNVVNADTTTTANITDSTNKRFITDAQQTVLSNTSGTNTGDNAVNSLYSGLATSKQDTLVSGTNIKTLEGQSLLGSGNIDLTKSDVGLSNVDNTSDATKNSAIATLTNKTINLTDNTLTGTTAQFNTALSDGDFATLAGSATLTNKTLSSGTIIQNATGTTNAQTGTTYTLLASDNGRIITLNNASAITLTVPSGLGAGFNCTVIQKGAGQVTFTASGTTIVNRQSHTKTAGQHAVCGLYADVANNFYLTGDTVA